MSPRALRGALLAGVLGLVLVVVLSLRRAGPGPGGAGSQARATRETRTSGLVYRSFKEGEERWVLEASGLRGNEGDALRLEGVRFTSRYTAQGEVGSMTIAAEQCLYTEAQEKAVFRRNVRITTVDGFELLTDSLTYRGDRGVAKTDEPARFRRKDVSGSSTGIDYDANRGRLVLPRDVVFNVSDPDKPPAEIRSRRAVAEKDKGLIRFSDDVEALQGGDRLSSRQLTLFFDADSRDLTMAIATGDVELRTTGGTALPGAAPDAGLGQGARVLRTKRLELRYRSDRSLESAAAIGDAELTLLPGPRDPREKRRLQAHALEFEFDAAGQLARSNGRKDALLTVEPLVKGRGETQVVKAQRFKARMLPGGRLADEIQFSGSVSFERGRQRASADRARYIAPEELLRLGDGPRLLQDGSQLDAEAISVGTRSGDIEARKDVRHLLRAREGAANPGLLSGGETPTLITSQEMRYLATTRTASYEGEALLRSGRDEIRAPTLVVEEDEKGARRLTASPSVVSLLHPRAAQPGQPIPAPVEARAGRMVYEEAPGHIAYSGDVRLRQGDILTKSPQATLTLTPDGRGIDRLVAGEPVEVQQGPRRASGRQGVYTPANETMVLTGDSVELHDGPRVSRGRSLTFHVGDDTILVDGREEGRTETILKKEPSQP